MNVVDEIAEPHRSTLVAVLGEKTPDLLAALHVGTVPTYAQWEEVQRVMSRAMSDHFLPGHLPDETGKAIDNALGAFLTRWPGDAISDYPYR
jgi:hypothetical protein